MAVLTIHYGHQVKRIAFDPPVRLSALFSSADIPLAHPCGGRGRCGKCAVVLSGDVSAPSASETRLGVRLSCQAAILGDADVTLPVFVPLAQISGGAASDLIPHKTMSGRIGAAVDIGTTTLALSLYDLSSSRFMGASSILNPQTAVAADVIGRIDAAMRGRAKELRLQVESAIETMLLSACSQSGILPDDVSSMVITGNTTMLYLLCGFDPEALSHAPFAADHLFGTEMELLGRPTYLPDCMHAFIGADTSCALLASGMLDRHETALLCDVGTNGELTLWHRGGLYIASTAAGPAFEGAGISCGCASIPGAIDKVELRDGQFHYHTIGDERPVGLCGSGLVDAIAALLKTGDLHETGYLEEEGIHLADGVTLTQNDIRAVQLAKAATNAGIMSLLSAADCPPEAVGTVYLAGGFGSHLNIDSAASIGLIPPELADRIRVIGNAALDGAGMLLMDTAARTKAAEMRKIAQHVRLDGNPEFAARYVEAMLFAPDDL